MIVVSLINLDAWSVLLLILLLTSTKAKAKAAAYCGFFVVDVDNAMADDHYNSEIVSTFLLKTCPRLQLNEDYSVGIQLCANIAAGRIPLLTGSVAEFKIYPMLPCFSDRVSRGNMATWVIQPPHMK